MLDARYCNNSNSSNNWSRSCWSLTKLSSLCCCWRCRWCDRIDAAGRSTSRFFASVRIDECIIGGGWQNASPARLLFGSARRRLVGGVCGGGGVMVEVAESGNSSSSRSAMWIVLVLVSDSGAWRLVCRLLLLGVSGGCCCHCWYAAAFADLGTVCRER